MPALLKALNRCAQLINLMEQLMVIQEGGDYIKVTPLKYAYPSSTDTYDRNWIEVAIKLRAGAFSGEYKAYFQTLDFEKLKGQMQQLYNDLSGSYEFRTLEDQLYMKFSGDGLGHINIECTAQDQAGNGNTLNFEMCIDQTSVKGLMEQLEGITNTFPFL
jgi:hypothetical protein